MYRIGVDVGGTNTDAVVMAGRDILAAVKVPTSADVTQGLMEALRQVQSAASSRPPMWRSWWWARLISPMP